LQLYFSVTRRYIQRFANINISHFCKFPTEYVGETIVKIGQYLAQIWTRVSRLPSLTYGVVFCWPIQNFLHFLAIRFANQVRLQTEKYKRNWH